MSPHLRLRPPSQRVVKRLAAVLPRGYIAGRASAPRRRSLPITMGFGQGVLLLCMILAAAYGQTDQCLQKCQGVFTNQNCSQPSYVQLSPCSYACVCEGEYVYQTEDNFKVCGSEKVCYQGDCLNGYPFFCEPRYGPGFLALENPSNPCVLLCVSTGAPCQQFEEDKDLGTRCYTYDSRPGQCYRGRCAAGGLVAYSSPPFGFESAFGISAESGMTSRDGYGEGSGYGYGGSYGYGNDYGGYYGGSSYGGGGSGSGYSTGSGFDYGYGGSYGSGYSAGSGYNYGYGSGSGGRNSGNQKGGGQGGMQGGGGGMQGGGGGGMQGGGGGGMQGGGGGGMQGGGGGGMQGGGGGGGGGGMQGGGRGGADLLNLNVADALKVSVLGPNGILRVTQK